MKTVLDDNIQLVNPDIMRGLGANCFAPELADINFVSDPKIGLSMIINKSSDDEDSLWHSTNQKDPAGSRC